MRISCFLSAIVLLVISGCSLVPGPEGPVASANPPVMVERINYKGWTDAVRLRNSSCELVVVPAVSRVMHFSLVGGPNLLWENAEFAGKTYPTDEGKWHNIGGDKLWPTQQSLFLKYTGHNDWPPPWPWDGGASQAELLPGGVRLTLPHDKRFGAHAVREFTLDAAKPLVHIRQRIEKTDGGPTDLTVWTVTQVNNPLVTLIPSEKGEYSNLGPASEKIGVHKNYLTLAREPAKGLKIGVTPQGQNGWVASVFDAPAGRQMLVLSHKLVEGGGYPDKNLQAELYTSPVTVGHYTEMELLSPLKTMTAGQTLADDAIWQIVPAVGEDHFTAATIAHQKALIDLK